MKVDMSPAAVTQRMLILNQLWELTVALQTAVIIDNENRAEDNAENKKISELKENSAKNGKSG